MHNWSTLRAKSGVYRYFFDPPIVCCDTICIPQYYQNIAIMLLPDLVGSVVRWISIDAYNSITMSPLDFLQAYVLLNNETI